ncbi:MAG: 2-amino-4-hydroxy-6-hydroxymethyldihydropteridine diphosphokinase [Gemmatimonadetes bacterium]|nr:2-amino-4-hydroxy-6-hydroxymethyldihydropteridine diphosphokinase [Gemmatimonadota bacterium]HRX18809.1 2-amino-4-hydroxy-6-hydroxymethyldihydropteridine diphosphokinase [Gemmatimonadales bacterium]
MIGTPVFVALGSNLGDREAALAFAVTALGAIEGVRVLAVTPALETEPLGGLPHPPYLNAMALLDVTCTPHELLAACQRIERQAGRRARTRWASRELDLDIVRFGDVVSEEPALRLPHPGLADRAFWIRQLEELEARVDG